MTKEKIFAQIKSLKTSSQKSVAMYHAREVLKKLYNKKVSKDV
jgi:predicted transcriptional regulator